IARNIKRIRPCPHHNSAGFFSSETGELLLSFARIGSSPVFASTCGQGGVGREPLALVAGNAAEPRRGPTSGVRASPWPELTERYACVRSSPQGQRESQVAAEAACGARQAHRRSVGTRARCRTQAGAAGSG